jgi:putative addiction module component (TIGR02574 family)
MTAAGAAGPEPSYNRRTRESHLRYPRLLWFGPSESEEVEAWLMPGNPTPIVRCGVQRLYHLPPSLSPSGPVAKIDIEAIKRLPIPERVHLAQEIWDSLQPTAEELPLTEEQVELLRERLDEHRRDPHSAVPWSEVKKRLGLK